MHLVTTHITLASRCRGWCWVSQV